MLLELKHLLIDVYGKSLGYFINPSKRIYWFYILTSIALACFVYFKYNKKKDSNKNLIKFLFPKENFFSKTALVDLFFLFFNAFVKLFIIATFSYAAKKYHYELTELIANTFGPAPRGYSLSLLTVFYLISLLVVGDFSYYILHLLYHKIPFMWAFHKVHHSSTALNPITQYRIHPVELVINNLRALVVITLVNSLFDYLNRGYFTPQTYFGVNILLLTFNSWGSNLRHSHIKLTYFNWLENFLISPFQHQIHHSSQKELHNKNLGSKLAIWDKIFGTLVKSKDVEKLNVGLGEKDKHYKSFFQNIINPFKSLFNSNY
tara:strand:+ start:3461 stop:4414 length:954 start_codon:yes stop_codon:yes gene_type:complete